MSPLTRFLILPSAMESIPSDMSRPTTRPEPGKKLMLILPCAATHAQDGFMATHSAQKALQPGKGIFTQACGTGQRILRLSRNL